MDDRMEGLTCPFCKGQMKIVERPRYNRILTSVIIVMGALSVLSIQGAVIGILFLAIGLIMAFAKSEMWYCNGCRAVIERVKEPDKEKD